VSLRSAFCAWRPSLALPFLELRFLLPALPFRFPELPFRFPEDALCLRRVPERWDFVVF
jgi:hypothetical protein